ncbi:hypothetical protein QSV34_08960 [Porticoccus sp. W117]|uniref:hypothetical protein n=1 Tax=Porticoccus sp. W117 TaxID=3054777 RepID=UPI00259182CB|nr:hypothetical protein [Porticoccus sp. W117]MDM3871484.1 hypothetical protein [Porticoccus sp. W117]
MADAFTEEERAALKAVLSQLVIQKRTGQVGIVHGANRFISTHICCKKSEKAVLHSVFKKLGLPQGINEVNF